MFPRFSLAIEFHFVAVLIVVESFAFARECIDDATFADVQLKIDVAMDDVAVVVVMRKWAAEWANLMIRKVSQVMNGDFHSRFCKIAGIAVV